MMKFVVMMGEVESLGIPLPRWCGIGPLQKVPCVVRQCSEPLRRRPAFAPSRVSGRHNKIWAVLEPHSLRAVSADAFIARAQAVYWGGEPE